MKHNYIPSSPKFFQYCICTVKCITSLLQYSLALNQEGFEHIITSSPKRSCIKLTTEGINFASYQAESYSTPSLHLLLKIVFTILFKLNEH